MLSFTRYRPTACICMSVAWYMAIWSQTQNQKIGFIAFGQRWTAFVNKSQQIEYGFIDTNSISCHLHPTPVMDKMQYSYKKLTIFCIEYDVPSSDIMLGIYKRKICLNFSSIIIMLTRYNFSL